VVIALAGCGGADSVDSSGIASLEDVAGAVESDGVDNGDSALEADEVALEFSQCMRDEGLDFDDIGLDADGNPDLRSSFQDAGIDPRSDEFRAAMTACGDILQSGGFGGGRARLTDDPEVQDALVAYSECLRDEGLDVGDLQLGGPPGGGAGAGDGGAEAGPQGGQGQGQGGFGNRQNRIAAQLGVDADDPTVAAALEVCAPILENTVGQGGRGGVDGPDGT
jgi:hypothetical protein